MNIEKRGETSWRLIVEDPHSAVRSPQKKTIRVKDPKLLRSESKLEEYLRAEYYKFKTLVESGDYVKETTVSFEDFATTLWFNNYARANLGPNTRRVYLNTIKSQLVPEFGKKKIGKISTIQIVNYFAKLRTPEGRLDGKEKPLSTNSLLNIYTALKSIFDCAYEWKIILKNPMIGVKRPKADKKERREFLSRKKSFTHNEALDVIQILIDLPENWSLYLFGVLLGGFRRGEMLAVEWSSVDYNLGGIYIKKQITLDEDGNKTEGEVKTVESEAFVTMPKFYMNALKQYYPRYLEEKERLGEKWIGKDKEYIFHSGKGDMYHPNAPTRYWGRLRKKHGFPNIRLHDLRHTTAMLLRDDAVNMKDIQERLRHARLETTNIYLEKSVTMDVRTVQHFNKYDPNIITDRNKLLGSIWDRGDE